MKETFDVIAVIALGIIFFELAYFLIKKNTKKVIPQDLETRIASSRHDSMCRADNNKISLYLATEKAKQFAQ